MSHEMTGDRANKQLPLGLNGARIYWHPYTDDTRGSWVDITGLDILTVLNMLGIECSMADALILEGAIRRGRPFHDPTVGCLVFDPN